MTSLQKAIVAFWSQFTYDRKKIPVYYSGAVPTTAEFPYITFDLTSGDPFAQGLNTAIVWFKRENGVSPIPKCAEVMDQIERAIPYEGKKIRAGDGMVVLYRNDVNFQTHIQDAEDSDVWGGRTSYFIRYYL